jgi:hypothetical protein
LYLRLKRSGASRQGRGGIAGKKRAGAAGGALTRGGGGGNVCSGGYRGWVQTGRQGTGGTTDLARQNEAAGGVWKEVDTCTVMVAGTGTATLSCG